LRKTDFESVASTNSATGARRRNTMEWLGLGRGRSGAVHTLRGRAAGGAGNSPGRRSEPARIHVSCELSAVDREERRDPANGHAAIARLVPVGLNREESLTVALCDEVLRRNSVFVGEDDGDALGAAIGEAEVVDLGADRIGVAFDEENLVWIALEETVHGPGEAVEFADLIGRDVP
jgi:hypothetical protein